MLTEQVSSANEIHERDRYASPSGGCGGSMFERIFGAGFGILSGLMGGRERLLRGGCGCLVRGTYSKQDVYISQE